MDITRYPADIWGIIFSQLDLCSMMSMAHTCRRFQEIFMTLPGTTLLGDRWRFYHQYKSEIPYRNGNKNLKQKLVHGLLTYSEAIPPAIRQKFVELQGPARLNYAEHIGKAFSSEDLLPGMRQSLRFDLDSGIVNYYIVVPSVPQRFQAPKKARRHHVFRMSFEGKKLIYTQFHRNGRVMIKATYQSSIMITCEMYNSRGKRVFETYLNRNDRTYHFGQREKWSQEFMSMSHLSSHIMSRFPPYIPQVIKLNDYNMLHRQLRPCDTYSAIQTSAIRAIYLTPDDLV